MGERLPASTPWKRTAKIQSWAGTGPEPVRHRIYLGGTFGRNEREPKELERFRYLIRLIFLNTEARSCDSFVLQPAEIALCLWLSSISSRSRVKFRISHLSIKVSSLKQVYSLKPHWSREPVATGREITATNICPPNKLVKSEQGFLGHIGSLHELILDCRGGSQEAPHKSKELTIGLVPWGEAKRH